MPASAAQRPGVAAGAATAAFAAQQTGDFVDQFAGDVEHGTIGDHVGSLGGERSCGENSLPRTPRGPHAHIDNVGIIRNIRVVRTASHLFTEITSLIECPEGPDELHTRAS